LLDKLVASYKIVAIEHHNINMTNNNHDAADSEAHVHLQANTQHANSKNAHTQQQVL
jgi:uncharacterized protein involved in high-affinity Fe2+ transport